MARLYPWHVGVNPNTSVYKHEATVISRTNTALQTWQSIDARIASQRYVGKILPHHVTVELLHAGKLQVVRELLYCLLDGSAPVHLQRQVHHLAVDQPPERAELLLRAHLEDLLDHIVAEDIRHEVERVREDLCVCEGKGRACRQQQNRLYSFQADGAAERACQIRKQDRSGRRLTAAGIYSFTHAPAKMASFSSAVADSSICWMNREPCWSRANSATWPAKAAGVRSVRFVRNSSSNLERGCRTFLFGPGGCLCQGRGRHEYVSGPASCAYGPQPQSLSFSIFRDTAAIGAHHNRRAIYT